MSTESWSAVDHAHYPGMMVVEGPEMPITIITSALGVDFESYLRRVANAHLIAAAPDLLRALEAAVAFIESHAADPDLTDRMCETYAAYLETSPRKTIAKAKGEI